ncbi:MFS transporter [Nonomuraea polychroma]|uniref:MFS transporter n=1 Tax=Nonomuraea polychroma TaxID=46176 RepID=A0A438LYC9_9ACTN|nr:MFS transporter [Nonomuraea polychroma]RVX38258.1 MFS transporter [Nonomuraea polychroma]
MNRLLIGRCLSALATALIPTTLTLAVLRTTGDGAALGVVLASEMVPLLLFLPVGGVLADRIRPQRVALLADLTRCLSQAAIAVELLLGVNRLLDLALLSAVAGVAIAFGSPAVPRLVVAVVPGPDRLRMNARIGVATSLSAVVAPALAGAITLAAGPGWAAALTAVLFACSALTLGGIHTASAGARTSGPGRTSAASARRLVGRGSAASSFGRDLVEGWREIRERPWFLACVLGHGVWHFMAGLFLTLGPVTAVQELGGEASWMVILQSGTVGLVLGVFAAPRLPIRRPLAVVQLGAACYVLPMVALAVTAPAPVTAGAYFVAMFGLGVLSPLWETVVADEIPEAALGRVRSFDQLISFASRPFGLAVAAPLAGLTGVTALALTGGVLVAAANLAAIVPMARSRRRRAAPEPCVTEGKLRRR